MAADLQLDAASRTSGDRRGDGHGIPEVGHRDLLRAASRQLAKHVGRVVHSIGMRPDHDGALGVSGARHRAGYRVLVGDQELVLVERPLGKVLIALVIVQWAYYARTARGAALVERNKEYVDAATCLALGHRRILFHHIAPNCMPPLIVIVTIQVADAIALEASLSFLGVGMPVTEPSLGLLIATGFDYLLSGSYWISLFPGVALAVTIVAINLVGDQLRDVLNPRLQR